MKKSIILVALALGLAVTACSSAAEDSSAADSAASVAYKDGTYEGESDKDEHGGIVKVTIEVKDSRIVSVESLNLDGKGKEKGEDYGKESNNEGLYKQAQKALEGAKTYAPKLVETQDITKVDAVSGATTSHESFVLAVERALEAAK